MDEERTSIECLPILILGIGNILMKDDGVGIRVVECLQQMDLPSGVEVVDGGTAGADLLDIIADRDHLIVVDSIDAEEIPGTILRLKPDELHTPGQSTSLHDFSILETLSVADKLGCAPKDVICYCVQIENITCAMELTPRVGDAVIGVARQILSDLEGR